MADLPAGLVPRGLSLEEAAAYCGAKSLQTFHRWRQEGRVPGPMAGTHTWDRVALDRALDRWSALQEPSSPSNDRGGWGNVGPNALRRRKA